MPASRERSTIDVCLCACARAHVWRRCGSAEARLVLLLLRLVLLLTRDVHDCCWSKG
jgi:hypothetical protein